MWNYNKGIVLMMEKNKKSVKESKGSFNYRSYQQKQFFKEKIALEGKTLTCVINDLIDNYINSTTTFSKDDVVKNTVKKLLLLLKSDEPNNMVIKKELESLWQLIQ